MTMPLSRKSTLLALGAAAVSGTIPQPARAEAMPLSVGILPISTNAAFYAAQKFGYFATENLAVTSTNIRGGAAAIPGMLNGSIDVTYSNLTTVAEAVARGIDLRLIIQPGVSGTKPPDSAALIKRKSDQIR